MRWIPLFCLLLAVAAFAQTPPKSDWSFYLESGDRSEKWNDLVKSGFESFEGGRFSTAAIFLEKALDLGCHDALVAWKLGVYRESRGHLATARDLLIEASKLFPKQYPAHPLAKNLGEHLGRIFFKLDRYDDALPYFESALKNTPDSFMLLFMTGQIFRSQKKYAEARDRFVKALNLPPPVGIANPRLSLIKELMIVSFEVGDLENCQSYIEAVLSQSPNDPTALSYRNRLQKKKFDQKQHEFLEKVLK